MPTMKELGLDKLTADERRALIEELESGLAEEPLPTGGFLTDAKRAELERRIAHADAHPEDGIPWEEIRDAAPPAGQEMNGDPTVRQSRVV